MLVNLIKTGTGAFYAAFLKCYSVSRMFFMNHLFAFVFVTFFIILSSFAMCISELEQARADNLVMKERIFGLEDELADSNAERKREAEHATKLADTMEDLVVCGVNAVKIPANALAFYLEELKRKADMIKELEAFQ